MEKQLDDAYTGSIAALVTSYAVTSIFALYCILDIQKQIRIDPSPRLIRSRRLIAVCLPYSLARLIQFSIDVVSPGAFPPAIHQDAVASKFAWGFNLLSEWAFVLSRTVLILTWALAVELAHARRGTPKRKAWKQRIWGFGMASLSLLFVFRLFIFGYSISPDPSSEATYVSINWVDAATSNLLTLLYVIYGVRLWRLCQKLQCSTVAARVTELKVVSALCIFAFVLQSILHLVLILCNPCLATWLVNPGSCTLIFLFVVELAPTFVFCYIIHSNASDRSHVLTIQMADSLIKQ